MKPSPFQALLKSRKFLLLLLDVFGSLLLLLLPVAFQMSPEAVDILVQVIALLQPVFFAVIGGIAYEDGQAKSGPNNVQVQNVNPTEEQANDF